MKREYWERLGLERELINLIMAENGRDLEALRARADSAAAERDEISARLSEAEAEREHLRGELESARSAPPTDDNQTLETALTEQKAAYEKALREVKTKYEAELAAAAIAHETALAAQKAEYEAASAERERRAQITELFGRAGFACEFVRDAAVERFLGEGGTSGGAGEWLTALRKTEPSVFMRAGLRENLPRFTAETPPSKDSDTTADAASGGLLLAVLKKLR